MNSIGHSAAYLVVGLCVQQSEDQAEKHCASNGAKVMDALIIL